MTKEEKWLLKEKYNNKPSKQFYSDIKRLNGGEPLDYVIGFTEFLGCRIDLSKKPLIPRKETEFWTATAIDEIKKYPSVKNCRSTIFYTKGNLRILDIFSGSGCIGIVVLKHIKNSKVDFADIDENNLEQIKINLKINQSLIRANKRRYEIIKSNIFGNVRGRYDYIFVNPPYIPTKNKKMVGASVLKYEPKKALFGGKDGMLFITKFLKKAKKHLNHGGRIFMEFDGSTGSPQVPPQKNKIEKLLKKHKYKKWQFNKDQYGKWRWVVIE